MTNGLLLQLSLLDVTQLFWKTCKVALKRYSFRMGFCNILTSLKLLLLWFKEEMSFQIITV